MHNHRFKKVLDRFIIDSYVNVSVDRDICDILIEFNCELFEYTVVYDIISVVEWRKKDR